MIIVDEVNRKIKLSLRQSDILKALAKNDELRNKGGCVPDLQSVTK